MRASTSDGAAAALAALGSALAARGVTDARLGVRELLWADAAMVVDVDVPADRLDSARAALAAADARELDPTRLPGGGAISNVARTRAGSTSGSTPVAAQWFSSDLGFDAAHADGLDGRGVRVAIVDSGVDADHGDLAAAVRRGSIQDRFGGTIASAHGTFVAGLVAGRRTGMAPGVELMSSRTYGAEFTDHRGFDDRARRSQRVNAIRALQDSLAPPDGSPGADVAVTSWGILDAPGVPARDYDQVMATMAAAGVVVVAAAGNDGAGSAGGTISVPAQLPDVLSVGGVDRALRWHPSASVGPSPRRSDVAPDLSAPVVDIRSTALGGGLVDTTGQDGGGFAGTSAAAPIAAAAVALLVQAVRDQGGAAPDLDEVRRVLPLLVRDVDVPGPDVRTGRGVIDVRRVRDAAAATVAARHDDRAVSSTPA